VRQYFIDILFGIKNVKYKIQFFESKNGKHPFLNWIEKLDTKTQARIRNRIIRMEDGNFGDYKSITQSLFELRLFFGPGYRVYFSLKQNEIIILLSGGDKGSQKKDIQKAIELCEKLEESQ
jgi:putative addiction module killer protein